MGASCRVTVHSVSCNTLRDAQIWRILPHMALAAWGFSCFQRENAFRYSGLCTITLSELSAMPADFIAKKEPAAVLRRLLFS